MVKLVDYMGADDFLRAAVGWLDLGVHDISNVNPVGCYNLFGGAIMPAGTLDGLCAWCAQWLEKEVVIPCKPNCKLVRAPAAISLFMGTVTRGLNIRSAISSSGYSRVLCARSESQRGWTLLKSSWRRCQTKPHVVVQIATGRAGETSCGALSVAARWRTWLTQKCWWQVMCWQIRGRSI